jgi:hypothetical protein
MSYDIFLSIYGIYEEGVQNSYIFRVADVMMLDVFEHFDVSKEDFTKISDSVRLSPNFIANKRSYRNGQLSMAYRIKFPFNRQTFSLDGIDVLGSVNSGTNTIVMLDGFPLFGDQPYRIALEVERIHAYRDRVSGILHRAPRDVLGLMLLATDPKSVKNLCQSNNAFREYCQRPEIFLRLLKKNYPGSYPTTDPKQQFLAIAEGIKTFYRLPILTKTLVRLQIFDLTFGPLELLGTCQVGALITCNLV